MSSIDVRAIEDNQLCNMFMVLQRGLKDVDFDELELRTMD